MTENINADTNSEPAVAQNLSAGQEFMKSVLTAMTGGQGQPAPAADSAGQPVAEPQPSVPQPSVPQPSVPQPSVPQPSVPQPPVPQPSAPLDYTTRYGGTQSAQPVLEPIPDLPPEPQISQPPDGQQIPNAAFAAMRTGYGQMRHLASDYRDKYNQLVEETKRYLGEKSEFAAQLNAKDEEIKKLQDEIGRIDLSRSPEFQQRYDAPLRDAAGEIERLLSANGIGQNEAKTLADEIMAADAQTLPDKIANLPTHVQGMIMYQAQRIDQLWTDRTKALDEWKQSAEGLAAVAARGHAIVDAQRTSQLVDGAITLVKSLPSDKGLPPAFQVTDPEFVADRETKEQQFRAWVQQAPDDQKMAAMFEGFMAPKTYEMLENTFRENIALKQMLYARTRVDAPPVASLRMPDPALRPPQTAPAPPASQPQLPTVKDNGFAIADTGTAAQAFAQTLIDSMRGTGPGPGIV